MAITITLAAEQAGCVPGRIQTTATPQVEAKWESQDGRRTSRDPALDLSRTASRVVPSSGLLTQVTLFSKAPFGVPFFLTKYQEVGSFGLSAGWQSEGDSTQRNEEVVGNKRAVAIAVNLFSTASHVHPYSGMYISTYVDYVST